VGSIFVLDIESSFSINDIWIFALFVSSAVLSSAMWTDVCSKVVRVSYS